MTVTVNPAFEENWITETAIRSAKNKCRVDVNVPDDDLPVQFPELILQAVSLVESLQWRLIIPKTITASLSRDSFPSCDPRVWLPYGQLLTDTLELTLLDSEEDSLLVSESDIRVYGVGSDSCWITPSLSFKTWESLWDEYDLSTEHPEPVTINWRAGYSSWSLVPASTTTAILLAVKHLYDGGDKVPDALSYWANKDKLEARESHKLFL